MNLKAKSLFIGIFLTVPFILFANTFENKIIGSVQDSKSGNNLKNVKVFLSETTFNTTTNENGDYNLDDVQPGLYKLVYRLKGYKPHIVEVFIDRNKTYEFDVDLISKTSVKAPLSSISIRNKEWKKSFTEFKKIFLGQSPYAEQTIIRNPEVIELYLSENNQLKAKSGEEIHLINKALGYEQFITIHTFSWNLKKDSGQFLNFVRANEMTPVDTEEAKLWEVNRASVYDNSFRKFLDELVHDKQSFKNQRWAYQVGNYGVKAWGNYSGKFVEVHKKELRNDSYLEDIYKNIHIYRIDSNYYSTTSIAVVSDYRERAQFSKLAKEYDRYGNAYYYTQHQKLSYIDHINADRRRYLLIDDYGNLLNPLEVTLSGHWAKQRMGDFLPYDYKPTSTSVASR